MIFPSSVPFVLSVMHREGNCCFSVYLFHIVKSIKYIHIYINIYIYIYSFDFTGSCGTNYT